MPITRSFAGSSQGLDPYWYQGKAELNRYALSQHRYGEIHPGEVVLIFVTEDFLPEKQVKNDLGQHTPSTLVMKTNLLRRFDTGIYDYSLETSVFTPVEANSYPATFKVTNSSQDWCGQSFLQINLNQDGYRYRLFSYFEKEGDQDEQHAYAPLEDEIFNRIRINPEGLPLGTVEMFPSTTSLRFSHLPFKARTVKATQGDYVGDDFSGQNLRFYQLHYPDLNRKIEYVYEANTPYEVVGWKDTYSAGKDKGTLTTLAKRTHQAKRAYWNENGLKDKILRSELGMDE